MRPNPRTDDHALTAVTTASEQLPTTETGSTPT